MQVGKGSLLLLSRRSLRGRQNTIEKTISGKKKPFAALVRLSTLVDLAGKRRVMKSEEKRALSESWAKETLHCAVGLLEEKEERDAHLTRPRFCRCC